MISLTITISVRLDSCVSKHENINNVLLHNPLTRMFLPTSLIFKIFSSFLNGFIENLDISSLILGGLRGELPGRVQTLSFSQTKLSKNGFIKGRESLLQGWSHLLGIKSGV